MPFPIEQNVGQAPTGVAYVLRGGDAQVSFAAGGIRLHLAGAGRSADVVAPESGAAELASVGVSTVAIDLMGASAVDPVGAKPSETVVSYFRGSADAWLTNVPVYQQVTYPNAWPGIDVRYERDPGTAAVKSSYLLTAGADPQRIRLAWRGVSDAHVLEDGGLEVATPTGRLRESAPIAWQDDDNGGHEPVSARFSLIATNADTAEVGLVVGAYDVTRPLMIDPSITYAGYIGGSGLDQATDVAVDSTGAAYVVGSTQSTQATGFPVSVGPGLIQKGNSDAFVAKVRPDGAGLAYAGFIGGSLPDTANGVAIDTSGNAYVIGSTDSGPADGFPIVGGLGAVNRGSGDAFVAKVRADGTGLIYSGIVGGDGAEIGAAVAVDAAGNAYITGYTDSVNGFPVGVGPRLAYNFAGDAFVGKIKADGSGFLYIGYIGGFKQDIGRDIAVDASGAAYVVGTTFSDGGSSFPVTVGPSKTLGGSSDAFIAKVVPEGTGFAYAGFIGGKFAEQGFGVAVDATGAAYVVGDTASTSSNDGFPAIVGPGLINSGGSTDGFVAKVKPDGTGLTYAGYIGGGQTDSARSVAVDSAGGAYVVGSTSSAVVDVGSPGTELEFAL